MAKEFESEEWESLSGYGLRDDEPTKEATAATWLNGHTIVEARDVSGTTDEMYSDSGIELELDDGTKVRITSCSCCDGLGFERKEK